MKNLLKFINNNIVSCFLVYKTIFYFTYSKVIYVRSIMYNQVNIGRSVTDVLNDILNL